MRGVVIGLAFGVGLLMAISGWARARRPALDARVAPYVRDVHPHLSTSLPAGTLTAYAGPAIGRLASHLGDLLGSASSVERRLSRAGWAMSVDDFRIRQLGWGAAAFAAALGASTWIWSQRGSGATALLIFCLAAFVVGVLAYDQRLSSLVTARERRMTEEFPAIADLLALAVAAGESPAAGLQRVVGVCHGDLADELSRVLADVRTGTPLAQGFDRLAARTGVTSIARFAEGLAVAVERGTPLVDVLHAQTADVRESSRRELMEAGGRREVLMMVPVVFLILPVTVVFAFYPGLVGLQLSTGS